MADTLRITRAAGSRDAVDRARLHPRCVVCGDEQAHGLGLTFVPSADGRGVEAVFDCRGRVEGYAGLVHGGVVSMLLDGAMGTMVQTLHMDEAAVRGRQFAEHTKPLKNFIDILCLTHPEMITDIHRQYLAAGADIIETNTFGATRIAMEDFQLESLARELNLAAAACARRAAAEYPASA